MAPSSKPDIHIPGHFRPAKLTAIVFDFDGTLYSQPRLRSLMTVELLKGMAKLPSQLRVLRVLRAYRKAHEIVRARQLPVASGETQLALASEIAGVPRDVARPIVEKWFDGVPLQHLQRCMRTEISRFLEDARSRGIRLGVVSDYPLRKKLEATGLAGVFDAAVSSFDGNVNVLKPDPKGLLNCLGLLEVAPDECIYVGDRADVDARCATLAGVASLIIGREGMAVPEAVSYLRFGLPG